MLIFHKRNWLAIRLSCPLSTSKENFFINRIRHTNKPEKKCESKVNNALEGGNSNRRHWRIFENVRLEKNYAADVTEIKQIKHLEFKKKKQGHEKKEKRNTKRQRISADIQKYCQNVVQWDVSLFYFLRFIFCFVCSPPFRFENKPFDAFGLAFGKVGDWWRGGLCALPFPNKTLHGMGFCLEHNQV